MPAAPEQPAFFVDVHRRQAKARIKMQPAGA